MEFIRNITGKELFKVTSLNSVSVLIRIAIGFVTSKVIAVYVGPAGMALVGNLRNFITSIESAATLGFQNGIVKYIAEYEANHDELKRFLFTVISVLLVVTFVLSGLLYFFAESLNDTIFGDNYKYDSVFRAFAIGLPWYIASIVLVSILNGFGKFRKVIYINILGNILGLAVSVLLIYYYRTYGALLAVIVAPSLLFFISVFFIHREIPFSGMFSRMNFRFSILSNLSEYSLMALASSLVGPLVLLSIRTHVIDVLGIDEAGYWEAMTRISSYYLLFLTTILGVYFLPQLSKAANDKETGAIFRKYYKYIMPIFIAGLIAIYFLRNVIIYVLFTTEFLPVSELFFWQLLGDVFKAASLILGYQFFARKLTVAFIITEISSLLIQWILSRLLVESLGIEGVVMAYAFTYIVYSLVLAVYFRKPLFGKIK